MLETLPLDIILTILKFLSIYDYKILRFVNFKFRNIVDNNFLLLIARLNDAVITTQLSYLCNSTEKFKCFLHGFNLNYEQISADFNNGWSNERLANIIKLDIVGPIQNIIFAFPNLQILHARTTYHDYFCDEILQKLSSLTSLKSLVVPDGVLSPIFLPSTLTKLHCHCTSFDFSLLPRTLKSLDLFGNSSVFETDGIPEGLTYLRIGSAINTEKKANWSTQLRTLIFRDCTFTYDMELPSFITKFELTRVVHRFDLKPLTRLETLHYYCSSIPHLSTSLTELKISAAVGPYLQGLTKLKVLSSYDFVH